MEYGLISHRAALNECYALDKDHLEIEIKTGYEVTEVLLCFGDPFSAGILGGAEEWSGETVPMKPGREAGAEENDNIPSIALLLSVN